MSELLGERDLVAEFGGHSQVGLGLSQNNISLELSWQGKNLFGYVFAPWDAQLESPKPYFHPLKDLAGQLVSLYRPHDHIWHKGTYFGVSNFGDHNFWGGPTYVRGREYQWLPNNGRIVHQSFDRLELDEDVFRAVENLEWIAQSGTRLAVEKRELAATVWPDDGAWVLDFRTTLTNHSDTTIVVGSPTTQGRDAAGYGGFFWRGPRSFSETGTVLVADSPDSAVPGDTAGGDELMGHRGAWMGYIGRHDGAERASTLLLCDHPENFCYPTRWFVRVNPYACLGSAPFFDTEYNFEPGAQLSLRSQMVVADAALGGAQAGELADRARKVDLLGPRR